MTRGISNSTTASAAVTGVGRSGKPIDRESEVHGLVSHQEFLEKTTDGWLSALW